MFNIFITTVFGSQNMYICSVEGTTKILEETISGSRPDRTFFQ